MSWDKRRKNEVNHQSKTNLDKGKGVKMGGVRRCSKKFRTKTQEEKIYIYRNVRKKKK